MFTRIFLLSIFLVNGLLAQGRVVPDREFIPENTVLPVELVKVKADITISQDVARVKLEQHFKNISNRRVEGDYIYSLPGVTQMDDFFLYINGKKIAGQLLDSKKARSIYEDIVRQMRDPALLEYADYGLFKASIFPLDPNQTRQIELSYNQVVSFESGNYKFELPIRQSGQGAIDEYEISIDLHGQQDLANIYSPSHKIEVDQQDSRNVKIHFKANNMDGSRNFVLFYSLANKLVNGSLLSFRPRTDRDGYFMFFANPAFGLEQHESVAKDVIFVIDVSGSMGGDKIDQAREALSFCVNILDENDRFEIISFSSAINSFSGGLIKAGNEEKQNARYFINNLSANGGTNINAALMKAFNLKKAKDTRPTSLVFLTDGLPTEGVTDIKKIVHNIQNASQGFIRMFNFGVGYDVNTWLLDKLALENGGSVTYVKPSENIESAISGLFTKISSPLLTDIKIKINGVEIYDVYPQNLPDLFKGQRMMITGRYRKTGKADLELTGYERGKNKSFKYHFDFASRQTENDFIAKLWAGRKINFLLNKIRFEGENDELVESVKNLAEEFGIVTPYTSYLVQEQNQELAASEARPDNQPMIKKLQDRKASLNAGGMGSTAYEALEVMSKDAAKSTGYSAVMSSSVRQKVMEAEQDEDMLIIHKNVAGKAFTLQDGIWKEQGIQEQGKINIIKFMSDDYLALSKKDKEIAKILAVGEQVLFNWKGTVYKVEKK